MDEKKDYIPYSASRWTDIPELIITGHSESTLEEREEYDRSATEALRKYGAIGEDEYVKDGKISKK